jgi:hypothetical protein
MTPFSGADPRTNKGYENTHIPGAFINPVIGNAERISHDHVDCGYSCDKNQHVTNE